MRIAVLADVALADALVGVAEPLVVGGHTHRQMVRPLPDGPDYANAGSIGMPYEGDPAAYWMVVDDGTPVLRPEWVSAFFEHGAGRGPAPGEPVYCA